MTIFDIDETTDFVHGMPLSENISLDLLTRGPANPLTYPFKITQTDFLWDYDVDELELSKIDNSLRDLYIKKWKIAKNLQFMSQNVLETLVSEFRTDLNIYTAFIRGSRNFAHPTSKHNAGEAVDISIKGWEANLFPLVGEIRRMLKDYHAEIGFVANQRTWIHIGVNGPHNKTGGDWTNPRYFTWDIPKGKRWSGIFPARGPRI